MLPLTALRRRVVNHLGQRRLARVAPQDIYGRMFAAYYERSLRLDSDLHEAAGAFSGAVDALIEADRYFYDLVVLEKDGQRIRVRDRKGREHVALDLVNNSYNDLEHVPENREALARFVRDEPLSSCISRKIAGLHRVHDALRTEMADFLGYETCVLGTTGYISQLSTICALFHDGDVVFSDQHNHSSIADGCRLSRARIIPFPHGDYDALEALLRTHRGRYNGAGICTDGVFSTKGSVAAIDRVVALAREHRCLSVVDDTHGTFVLGRRGRGVLDLFDARPDVLTGGFGKGLGSFGGFAACSRELGAVIDIMGRQNVNSSFMSPVVAAQCLIHLRHYQGHHDTLAAELRHKLATFNTALDAVGLACYPTEPPPVPTTVGAPRRPSGAELLHPVFCFYKARELDTLACQRQLLEDGFLPSFFPPPVAPAPSLRISLHRCLPEDELVRLAHVLGTLGLSVDPGGLLASAGPTLPACSEPARGAPEAPLRPLAPGVSQPAGG